MKQRRVCLVTPSTLSCNPRLVKEADALHDAGYEVVVVCSILGPLAEEHSKALLDSKPWSGNVVHVKPDGIGGFLQRAASKAARETTRLAGHAVAPVLAEWRHSSLCTSLRRAVESVQADMYIAHNLPALAAAGPVSMTRNVPLGFDAEDAHHMELCGSNREERAELSARIAIEKRWLPRCGHLTAAAPLIAESYAARYGVRMTTVLNVFSLVEAPAEPLPAPDVPMFYWFSQKIGPGRGIEEMIQILRLVGSPIRLSLRGVCSDEYRRQLLASASPVELEFLAPASPTEMVRLAASATAGVCVELPLPPHRDVCLTNKLFTYLLAGVPAILSKTAAHSDIIGALGDAAVLIDIAAPEQSAIALTRFVQDREKLARRRAAAWRAARNAFNWEHEAEVFLASVDRALGVKRVRVSESESDIAAVRAQVKAVMS